MNGLVSPWEDIKESYREENTKCYFSKNHPAIEDLEDSVEFTPNASLLHSLAPGGHLCHNGMSTGLETRPWFRTCVILAL